jgi:hypothetical protein
MNTVRTFYDRNQYERVFIAFYFSNLESPFALITKRICASLTTFR